MKYFKHIPNHLKTPVYFYDLELLKNTLCEALRHAQNNGIEIHYALKANNDAPILDLISQHIKGADIVSGGELEKAINHGFDAKKIFFAGVGKSDFEIETAIKKNIQGFTVESIEELEIIAAIAEQCKIRTNFLIRFIPEINPHTHEKITTGTYNNKFGIAYNQISQVKSIIDTSGYLHFMGIHFHIGSQITSFEPFNMLVDEAVETYARCEAMGLKVEVVNFGGGLGISYNDPLNNLIPDFKSYFSTLGKIHKQCKDISVHVELGRSLVGQCGLLLSKVLYTKENPKKKFVIIDAGMNDLLRPALYNSEHFICKLGENSELIPITIKEIETYDIVGPVCESSDVFCKDITGEKLTRGDILAICSVGAYGRSMASTYNLRPIPNYITN